MSDFDKDEWSDDHHVKPGKVWLSVTDHRASSEFCDILLRNGLEVGPCWPRAKDFVDLSSDEETVHPRSNVTHVRYYDSKTVRDDEEDEDDGEDDDEI